MIRIVLVALACVLSATVAAAQSPAPASETSRHAVEFLPRAALALSAEHLSGDDPRFVWDTNFGGEIDLVDYGRGRATFRANYQAILGEELHAFDPNQGNYFLTGSASVRWWGAEFAGVFHHESRHLSDRVKRLPVDWNMVGGRVMKAVDRHRVRLDSRVDLRGVIQKSFVDYKWELDGDFRGRYPVGFGLSFISDVDIRVLGVDGTLNRGTQHGARAEGGIRFEGRGGAAELFIATERRIDPYPLTFGTETWFIAGFRLLSR